MTVPSQLPGKDIGLRVAQLRSPVALVSDAGALVDASEAFRETLGLDGGETDMSAALTAASNDLLLSQLRQPNAEASGGVIETKAGVHLQLGLSQTGVPGVWFCEIIDNTAAPDPELQDGRPLMRPDILAELGCATSDMTVLICALSETIIDANLQARQALGLGEDDLSGQPAIGLITTLDRKAVFEALDALQQGKHGHVERTIHLVRADATTLHARVTFRRVKDKILLLAQDLTELDAARRSVQDLRQYFLTAIESLQDGFEIYDPDDRLVAANARCREFFPRSATAMVPGARFEDILRSSLRRKMDGSIRQDELAWLEDRLSKSTAETACFEQPTVDGGMTRSIETRAPNGCRVVIHRNLGDLLSAQREKDSALLGSQALLNRIHKDISIPVDTISGLVDVAATWDLSPVQRAMIIRLGRSTETIASILGSAMVSQERPYGGMVLGSEVFSPLEALEEEITSLVPIAETRSVHLALRAPTTAMPDLVGDHERVRQILRNLVRYMIDPGKGDHIDIRVACPSKPGLGVTLNVNAKVFQDGEADLLLAGGHTRRLRSLEPRSSPTHGLSIVRELLERMDGRIEITTTPIDGTRVELWLPLPEAGMAGTGEPNDGLASSAEYGRAPLRVLAAEDNEAYGAVLKRLLATLGHDITLVTDGREAVQAWEAGTFDLLLFDVYLPGMSGIEALSAIRHRSSYLGNAPPRAIAITAFADEKLREELHLVGFATVVEKPIRLADLATAMATDPQSG